MTVRDAIKKYRIFSKEELEDMIKRQNEIHRTTWMEAEKQHNILMDLKYALKDRI